MPTIRIATSRLPEARRPREVGRTGEELPALVTAGLSEQIGDAIAGLAVTINERRTKSQTALGESRVMAAMANAANLTDVGEDRFSSANAVDELRLERMAAFDEAGGAILAEDMTPGAKKNLELAIQATRPILEERLVGKIATREKAARKSEINAAVDEIVFATTDLDDLAMAETQIRALYDSGSDIWTPKAIDMQVKSAIGDIASTALAVDLASLDPKKRRGAIAKLSELASRLGPSQRVVIMEKALQARRFFAAEQRRAEAEGRRVAAESERKIAKEAKERQDTAMTELSAITADLGRGISGPGDLPGAFATLEAEIDSRKADLPADVVALAMPEFRQRMIVGAARLMLMSPDEGTRIDGVQFVLSDEVQSQVGIGQYAELLGLARSTSDKDDAEFDRLVERDLVASQSVAEKEVAQMLDYVQDDVDSVRDLESAVLRVQAIVDGAVVTDLTGEKSNIFGDKKDAAIRAQTEGLITAALKRFLGDPRQSDEAIDYIFTELRGQVGIDAQGDLEDAARRIMRAEAKQASDAAGEIVSLAGSTDFTFQQADKFLGKLADQSVDFSERARRMVKYGALSNDDVDNIIGLYDLAAVTVKEKKLELQVGMDAILHGVVGGAPSDPDMLAAIGRAYVLNVRPRILGLLGDKAMTEEEYQAAVPELASAISAMVQNVRHLPLDLIADMRRLESGNVRDMFFAVAVTKELFRGDLNALRTAGRGGAKDTLISAWTAAFDDKFYGRMSLIDLRMKTGDSFATAFKDTLDATLDIDLKGLQGDFKEAREDKGVLSNEAIAERALRLLDGPDEFPPGMIRTIAQLTETLYQQTNGNAEVALDAAVNRIGTIWQEQKITSDSEWERDSPVWHLRTEAPAPANDWVPGQLREDLLESVGADVVGERPDLEQFKLEYYGQVGGEHTWAVLWRETLLPVAKKDGMPFFVSFDWITSPAGRSAQVPAVMRSESFDDLRSSRELKALLDERTKLRAQIPTARPGPVQMPIPVAVRKRLNEINPRIQELQKTIVGEYDELRAKRRAAADQQRRLKAELFEIRPPSERQRREDRKAFERERAKLLKSREALQEKLDRDDEIERLWILLGKEAFKGKQP
ncbi:MAG: hypothetical protein ACE5HA_03300 [Anaerolineae bacterium]